MILLLTSTLFLTSLAMIVTWGVALRMGNPGIVDVAWSSLIALLGLVYLSQNPMTLPTAVFGLVLLIWACRLATYLFVTRVLQGHQDPRYQALAQNWGERYKQKLLTNYLTQGFLLWLVALPFLFITGPWQVVHTIGLLCIIAGLTIEIIADNQLHQFALAHAGQNKVCDTGLWRYSRHPNYFGEWMIWVGFALAALATPNGRYAVISPIVLYVIMAHITGPMTEVLSLRKRGEAFKNYQATTSYFFPWPPKG